MDFWANVERMHPHLRGLFFKWSKDPDKASAIFEFACSQCHRRYREKEPLSLKRLLCKVARNHLFDLARQERRRRKELHGLDLQEFPDRAGSAPSLDFMELQARVDQELDRLPPRWSLVLRRRWFENQPFKRIAEDLGVTIGNVKGKFSKAKMRLRARLAEFGPD